MASLLPARAPCGAAEGGNTTEWAGALPSGNRPDFTAAAGRVATASGRLPAWYVPAALRQRKLPRGRPAGAAVVALGALLALAGCGPHKARQDVDEPSGVYKVRVLDASFPTQQKLARRSKFKIVVRNVDVRTVPNLAVTVSGFDVRGAERDSPNADPTKPVFSVNEVPQNGETYYVNTFAVGKLRPGEQKALVWDVTAVRPGPFKVNWKVSAGLDGKAKARGPDGRAPSGRFAGTIVAGEPVSTVDQDDGSTIIREGERVGPKKPGDGSSGNPPSN